MVVAVSILYRGVVLCSWSFCARGAVVDIEWLIPAVPFTLPGSRGSRVVGVVVFVSPRSVVLWQWSFCARGVVVGVV